MPQEKLALKSLTPGSPPPVSLTALGPMPISELDGSSHAICHLLGHHIPSQVGQGQAGLPLPQRMEQAEACRPQEPSAMHISPLWPLTLL